MPSRLQHPSGVGPIGLLVLVLSGPPAAGQTRGLPLPPTAGVTLVQTLASSDGDRESVHTVVENRPDGLLWMWSLIEITATGDTIRERFRYEEAFRDLADAIRLRAYHEKGAPAAHPGYTMHAISRAVYRRLLATGSDTFQIMSVRSPRGGGFVPGFGAARPTPIRWRGTLSLASRKTVPFPLLVNGRRVEVPAWQVRGHFTAPAGSWDPQFMVLADSTYPLLLKWVGAHDNTGNVLQTIRIDGGTGGSPADLELALGTGCRAELPGVYFAFNSAALNEASDGPIAAVAGLLARHPDWTLTVEGHTDSVGTATANRDLSVRRVEAVVARLVGRHRVDPARLRVAGQGSDRPREPNATIEGRARNRRVELVRDC